MHDQVYISKAGRCASEKWLPDSLENSRCSAN